MTAVDLPDQPERDAIRGVAPGSLDRTVFVDAGAGTGKTTALVDRVVNLVCSGVPVGEIAAITFTEAAASELRHRVREAVELAIVDAGPGDERERLERAQREVDEASFTTLHAFAQRILLDHPLEAQLPPELELLTDIEEAAGFDKRWDAWLADFVGRDAIQPVLEHLDHLRVEIPRVRRLARALHDDYHRIPPELAVEPTSYEAPPLDVTEVLTELDELAALADDVAANDPDDKLVASLREWHAAAEPLRQAIVADAKLEEQLAALDHLAGTELHRGGAKKAWGDKETVSAVTKRRKAVRDELIPRVHAAQYDHLLRAMVRWTACFVQDWAAERRRQGVLVFQDLLVLARDVLRDHAEVRQRVRDRYRNLLIDEFQDTDPIQIEIAALLATQDHDALAATARPDGSVPWEDAALVPGRLFFVGDPKQSIYRFRGADIAVYEAAKSFVEAGGERRELTHNFRSVPGVLDWVNAAFRELFVPRERAQPDYLELTGQRGSVPETDGSAVRWFGGPGGKAEDVRDAEAHDVVEVVRRVVGQVPIADSRTGEVRPAQAADIAVLVRRHATARQLERCFEDAGLSLVVEARSLIFSSDEVRDLTTILTAIEDPNDEVAVLGALRHAAFGCSDIDLVDWVANGHRWWFPRPDEDPVEHSVGRALHRLAVLREGRLAYTVGGFVEHVIAETRLAELVLAHTRYRDRWRRIRFVADQAHAFHAAGGHLRGFVRWLADQADEQVRRDEHVVPDTDDDAVHVTTVHAAKGLEYPVVIVLGLDTATTKPLREATLLWSDDGQVEVNISSDAKTAGYRERADEERQFHREEEQRLLYVATTRARDLLIVSRHHSERNQECHAVAIAEIEQRLEPYWDELDLSRANGATESAEDEPTAETAADKSGRLDELRQFEEHHREAAASAMRPRVLAATTIAGLLSASTNGADAGSDEAEPTDESEDGAARPQPWRKGRSGSAIGRAVHAVLQSLDLASLRSIEGHARVQCAAEGLDQTAVSDVAAMVRRAAEAPIVREAVASGRYWREFHVGAPLDLPGGGTVTVEGFIDLLVEIGEDLVVVDYKTDSTRDRSAAEVVTKYRPQAATYALALEASLGRPIPRCIFVLSGGTSDADRQIEVAGDDLTAAKAELLDALAAR